MDKAFIYPFSFRSLLSPSIFMLFLLIFFYTPWFQRYSSDFSIHSKSSNKITERRSSLFSFGIAKEVFDLYLDMTISQSFYRIIFYQFHFSYQSNFSMVQRYGFAIFRCRNYRSHHVIWVFKGNWNVQKWKSYVSSKFFWLCLSFWKLQNGSFSTLFKSSRNFSVDVVQMFKFIWFSQGAISVKDVAFHLFMLSDFGISRHFLCD